MMAPTDSVPVNRPRGLLMRTSSLPGAGFPEHDQTLRMENGYSARAIFSILNRHKGLIFGCIALLTLASAVISFVLSPSYQAEALLILDTRRPEVVQQPAVLSNLVSGSVADAAIVRTEVTLISSPSYARRLIERLDLLHNVAFSRDNEPGLLASVIGRSLKYIEDTIANLRGIRPPADASTAMGRAIAQVKRQLTVYNDERSYAISLRYQSQNPDLATTIVNTLALLYVSDQLQTKLQATQNADRWLQQRLKELQANLRASDQKVAEFEQQHHLENVLTGNMTEQRLHELTIQMMAAADDRAKKEGVLAQVQDMLKLPGGAAAAAQVLSSPLIQRLREQEADAAARVAALKEAYNSTFTRGAARTKEYEQMIATEIQRITTALAGEVSAAKTRENSLSSLISQQQAELDTLNAARVQLAALERDASSNRNLYDTFVMREEQVEADEQSVESGARMVPAEVPTAPSFPNKLLFTGFGFFGSLFLGVLLAFVAERLDETIRTPDDAERLTGAPMLGIVPRVRNGRLGLASIIDKPMSAYAEAINNILITLRAGEVHGGRKVIAVSSAIPNEGKTFVAASVARAAAKAGVRTLLIDCDMRRPAVDGLFGHGSASLPTATSKRRASEFSEFVQTDTASGLCYLSAHRMTSNPQEIVGSQWISELIAHARADYDFVVLDTPPVLTVSDALLLSAVADITLLVVRWGRTPSGLVAEAMRMLHLHGKSSLGTILSLVDTRKYLQYRSGGYYYGKAITNI